MYFKTLLFISLLGFSYLFADTKLLILGSGTPNPNPERSGSAYAIIANDESYLIDFGPGVIRRASAFSPTWGGEFEAMEIQNLKYAFLTHLHSDHSAGLADLILSPWVLERNEPLNLFGPKGLKEMAEKISKGKINKFISENTLLNQAWIIDPQKKISDILKEEKKSNEIKIIDFIRFKVGEGV